MAIITISRGSYSRGKEVAESLAVRLGYECVSRDILLAASTEFNIPEIRLVKALHDAPSVLDRFSHGRERFISYLRSSLYNCVIKDNVVYHGLAGHFFLQDISHVLKVRIIANMDDRIKEEMKRENCSADEARYSLKKDDDERRKWAMHLYGKDNKNCDLYDMVFHIDILSVDDVVGILQKTIKKDKFKATPESRKKLEMRTLIGNIYAKIVDISPRASVEIDNGTVLLGNLEGGLKNNETVRRQIADAIVQTYGVEKVVFKKPVRPRKNHVNPFHNID
ncbi:MAG: cytidylate kinase-like family protein [Deltaproteobacteria bacterium]|nr:cytidylate kinase-like family protein [Deltaproteobacteria bacterium]MBW2658258.1 cytidylate kinase-like family protein [Deltaproteobacteria bacterium]